MSRPVRRSFLGILALVGLFALSAGSTGCAAMLAPFPDDDGAVQPYHPLTVDASASLADRWVALATVAQADGWKAEQLDPARHELFATRAVPGIAEVREVLRVGLAERATSVAVEIQGQQNGAWTAMQQVCGSYKWNRERLIAERIDVTELEPGLTLAAR